MKRDMFWWSWWPLFGKKMVVGGLLAAVVRFQVRLTGDPHSRSVTVLGAIGEGGFVGGLRTNSKPSTAAKHVELRRVQLLSFSGLLPLNRRKSARLLAALGSHRARGSAFGGKVQRSEGLGFRCVRRRVQEAGQAVTDVIHACSDPGLGQVAPLLVRRSVQLGRQRIA